MPVRSIAQAKGVTNGYWFGVASDQALADPKRNTALQDLLVRFEKAARWAKDHPQQWAQSYAAAVGLDPKVAAVVAGPQPAAAHRAGRRGGRLRAEAGRPVRRVRARSQSAPKFADWVDRRYNDVLAPLLISTN